MQDGHRSLSNSISKKACQTVSGQNIGKISNVKNFDQSLFIIGMRHPCK